MFFFFLNQPYPALALGEHQRDKSSGKPILSKTKPPDTSRQNVYITQTSAP
jgi:hypothetical protein